MKLYTEEQVKDMLLAAISFAGAMQEHHIDEFIKKHYTPIELPSDEEIHKQATNYSNFYYDFRAGAEWMKEQILIQNK